MCSGLLKGLRALGLPGPQRARGLWVEGAGFWGPGWLSLAGGAGSQLMIWDVMVTLGGGVGPAEGVQGIGGVPTLWPQQHACVCVCVHSCVCMCMRVSPVRDLRPVSHGPSYKNDNRTHCRRREPGSHKDSDRHEAMCQAGACRAWGGRTITSTTRTPRAKAGTPGGSPGRVFRSPLLACGLLPAAQPPISGSDSEESAPRARPAEGCTDLTETVCCLGEESVVTDRGAAARRQGCSAAEPREGPLRGRSRHCTCTCTS